MQSPEITRHVFLGRQAIFDDDRRVVAYELLYRVSAAAIDALSAEAHRTSHVMIDALRSIGLDRLVGGQRAFLNMDTASLLAELPLQLPPQRVVVEVLETVAPEPQVLAALRHLRDCGYRIALDDVVYQPALDPLLELADIVKVDLPAIAPGQLAAQVDALRRFGVELLAEKVESEAQFERTRQLGFTMFQGYWLARPSTVSGKRSPVQREGVLHLLARLQDPSLRTRELQELVRNNASLSHRLLRYINSAAIHLPRRLDSIAQAVVLVGQRHIRQVASLLLLDDGESPPPELIRITLLRARMCEQLASRSGLNADAAFTVGLLSTADMLFGDSLPHILAALPLNDAVVRAVSGHAGPLGQLLAAVTHYEAGDFDHHAVTALANQDFTAIYLEAVEFIDNVLAASRG